MAVADREQWCSEAFIGAGWLRHLPDRALLIVTALVARGPSDMDALQCELCRVPGLETGWLAAAWEPAHPWTDAELDDLRPELPESAAQVSASEVIAQEAAARASRIADLEVHAGRLGIPAPTTMGGAVDFLVACGVLVRDPEGGGRSGADVLDLASAPPLPAQVLELSVQEAALEDQMRSRRSRPSVGLHPQVTG